MTARHATVDRGLADCGALARRVGLALVLLAQTPATDVARVFRPAAAAARENAYRANNIGVARLEQYDFPAAIAAFRRALEIDPALALARLNLGIALFYGGEPEAARKELEAAKTALPDRPQPDYVLGLIARAADRAEDAASAFAHVRELDPSDVGAAINLGQLLVQQRRFDEAIKLLRPAVEAEPFNATAAYGLATALVRSGAADEGRTAMDKFQKLRESGYAVTFSQAYLEQGRYAEAIASTGAEAGLVNEAMPDVRFVDLGTVATYPAAADPGGLTLADLDGDGDADLVDAGAAGLKLYRNDGGKFTAMPLDAALTAPATAAIAGDYDNDGDADLLVLRASGIALLRQEAKDAFADATRGAGLSGVPGAMRTAAWLDADHDGDLDLLIGGVSAPARLLRNNGKGTFEDVTAAAALGDAKAISAVVPTDYDNRRDIDLLLVRPSSPPALYRNMRDGTFKDVARDVGLAFEGPATMAAAGDINKDGFVDFFHAGRDAGQFAVSDGRGGYVVSAADRYTAGATAAQFVDYDNDGLLDLRGGYTWRYSSAPESRRALARRQQPRGNGSRGPPASGPRDRRHRRRRRHRCVVPDADRDPHPPQRWRQPRALGARAAHRARQQPQRARRQDRDARRQPASAAGNVFRDAVTRACRHRVRPRRSHRRRCHPRAVALGNPAGGSCASITSRRRTPLTGVVKVEELDRKPSSCPFLFTWNGTKFEFLTDFLGGGEMGYWEAPGLRNTPDPDEYVRIPGDKLQPRDGRLDLRVTNELEEALFFDRAQLVAVAHPRGTDIYPNEGLRTTAEPFRLFTTRAIRPLAAAIDEHGHDVADRLRSVDRSFPDDFAKESIRGYAAEHSLTLTLPPADADGRRVLLMTGWTDYSFSGDNVAAHQRGLKMIPPMLQVPDGPGRWRTVIGEIGFPVGRPQTVPVDLTGVISRDATVVRIVTTMRVYWDQIVVSTTDESVKPGMTRLEPVSADLRWRGFSAEVTPDGREPFVYDYERVSGESPWKVLPGRYTRLGDVRDLLHKTDDFFVVARPGDEVALSFDATALPPLPDGWTRTFLLYGSGYSKEMDLNSSSPDVLAPLPFAGMKAYPYGPADGPRQTSARQRYIDRYLTRIVARPLPPIELIGAR